jgi:hypothetical protein
LTERTAYHRLGRWCLDYELLRHDRNPTEVDSEEFEGCLVIHCDRARFDDLILQLNETSNVETVGCANSLDSVDYGCRDSRHRQLV